MLKLLKAEDVAKILNCPVSTVYSFHQIGRLKGIKIGKLLRFDQQEIEDLINKQISKTSSNPNPADQERRKLKA